MNPEDQIKALASLDGYENVRLNDRNLALFTQPFLIGDRNSCCRAIPDYLASYDAIIPLIQKHEDRMVMIEDWIETNGSSCFWYMATPAQLCEALLRATGKWKE